jgi:hypothetical protein
VSKNGKGKKEKKEKKEKKGKSKKEKSAKPATPAKPAKPMTAETAATYADGAPLDRVTYLEAKLILKPDRFVSVQAFRDFVFGDTPDFKLYNNAFILRRRIAYVDGFPVGDPEIVFKFRHPDEGAATGIDVRPKIAGAYRIKFKAEILPLKDQVGGYRILFSHNCQFGVSQMHEGDQASMATLVKVFPALGSLQNKVDERIGLVNGGIVEEVLLPLGQLDFGKGLVGKCDIGLWRTRGEHKSLVGEFAFQLKFARKEDVAEKQKKLVAQFYVSLQREVQDWLALGVTKTAMVYRLNGSEPQSHE